MPQRKWRTCSLQLLDSIPEDLRETTNLDISHLVQGTPTECCYMWVIPTLKKLLRKISRSSIMCHARTRRGNYQLPMSIQQDLSVIGIDIIGPLLMMRSNPRKPTMASVVIFFVTRSIHFKIVIDLSSNAFLAAFARFARFATRRGLQTDVFSDNRTNFVGALAELQRIMELLGSKDTQETVAHLAQIIFLYTFGDSMFLNLTNIFILYKSIFSYFICNV